MLKDLFFLVAFLLIACVDYSWGACNSASIWGATLTIDKWCSNCSDAANCPPSWCQPCSDVIGQCPSSIPYNGSYLTNPSISSGQTGCSVTKEPRCYYGLRCDSQDEADSVACLKSGKLWIDGSCKDEQDICVDSGGTWEGDSCKICDQAKHMPNECERVWNTGYNLQGYWSAVVYEVTYNECTGEYTKVELSNVPEVECSDIMNDSTQTPNRCLAVVGSQCVMQSGNGQTYNCDCDGDCTQAMISPNCKDPFQSSPSSSDSQSSDSQSSDSQSSPSSSGSEGGEGGSGSSPGDSSGGDWEYNYFNVLDSIKWQGIYTNSNLYQIGNTLNRIDSKLGNMSSTTPGSSASGGGVLDSLHNSNQLLEGIANNTAVLGDTLPDNYFDISSFISGSDSILNKLQNPDTTYLKADSIAPDTSNFKSRYSKFFLSNGLTRNGCYEFHIASSQGWKIGAIDIDFGNVAGKFDFCAIFRGLIRICGAILCLIMTIKAYRSAFASGDD